MLQTRDTTQLVLQRAGRKGTAVLYCRADQLQPLSGVRGWALKQEPGNRLCCACRHEQALVTRPYCSISTCRESGSKISPATQFSRIKWTQGLISPPQEGLHSSRNEENPFLKSASRKPGFELTSSVCFGKGGALQVYLDQVGWWNPRASNLEVRHRGGSNIENKLY